MVATPWCSKKRHASSWKPPLQHSLSYGAAPESPPPAPAAAVAQLSSGCGLSAAGDGPAAAKAEAAWTQKRSERADAALTAQQLPHCACKAAQHEKKQRHVSARTQLRALHARYARRVRLAAAEAARSQRGFRIALRSTTPPLAPGTRLVEHDVGAAVEGVARVEARGQARRVGDDAGLDVATRSSGGADGGERKQQETGVERAQSHGGARGECPVHRQRANKKSCRQVITSSRDVHRTLLACKPQSANRASVLLPWRIARGSLRRQRARRAMGAPKGATALERLLTLLGLAAAAAAALKYATLLVWLGLMHINTLAAVVAVACLPHPAAATCLAVLCVAALLPVDRPFAPWQQRLARHISDTAHAYFPISMHCEDAAAFEAKGDKFVIGVLSRCRAAAPALAPWVSPRARRA